MLVHANVVPSSLIVSTMMMEEIGSFETSDLSKAYTVTSKKTPFFMVTAVKTSNLT
jgi:hypothetical protein